jgi:predicted ferric reductase
MLDQMLSINWTAVLMVVGYVVGAYVLLCVLVGIFKGWPAVVKILFWTKKLWWLGFIIIGLILVAYSMKGKKKQQEEISGKIEELRKIENKTAEDERKLKELEVQKKKAEQEALDIAKKYKEKLDKLKEKPPEPKPGDAGRSSDGMNDAWR